MYIANILNYCNTVSLRTRKSGSIGRIVRSAPEKLNTPIASPNYIRLPNFVKRIHGPASLNRSHPRRPVIRIPFLSRSRPNLIHTLLQLFLKFLNFILQSQSLFSVFRRELKQMRQETPCFSFSVSNRGISRYYFKSLEIYTHIESSKTYRPISRQI